MNMAFTGRACALLGVFLVLALPCIAPVHAAGDPQRLEEAAQLFQEGQKLFEDGEEAQAEEFYARALDIRVQELDPQDEVLGDTSHELAAVQINQDKDVEAERNFRAARAIYEAIPDLDKTKLASVLNGLSYALTDQERYVEAEQVILASIEMQRAAGPEKFNGRSYRALGNTYLKQKRYIKAREAFRTYKAFLEARTPRNEGMIKGAQSLIESARSAYLFDIFAYISFAAFVLTTLAVAGQQVWAQRHGDARFPRTARLSAGLCMFAHVGASLFAGAFATLLALPVLFPHMLTTNVLGLCGAVGGVLGLEIGFVLYQAVANAVRRLVGVAAVRFAFAPWAAR